MAICDRCSGTLSECACMSVEAGSEQCLRCGQGRPLPKLGTTRPVPHKARECLPNLQATLTTLRAQLAEATRRAEAAEATIEQALVTLEANARQHDCAGVDCANCGGPQASHELREYLATLDPKGGK